MKNKILNDIRSNIYLYILIVFLCIVLSFVLAFLFDDTDYVGHTTIRNGIGSNIVEIKVITEDKESTSDIITNITNESISQIHNELNVDVNKTTTIRKNIDFVSAIVRGLIIGLVISGVVLLNVFLPKTKVKTEDDINEIFVDVPILAKIPNNYINEDNNQNERQ